MVAAVSWVCLYLNRLLAGVFLGSALVEQAMRHLGASDWLAYKQAKERLFGPVMPVFFGVTLLVSIVHAAVSRTPTSWLTVSLLVAALVITVVVHLPLNRTFQRWTSATTPPAWNEQRRRWRDWNCGRGFLAVAAFTSATIA